MADVEHAERIQIGSDLVKFLGLSAIAGAFVLGHSYAYSFYRAFGIDLNEANLSYNTLAIQGLSLMADIWVLLGSVGALLLSAVLLSLMQYLPRWVFLSAAMVLFIGLSFGATKLGTQLGETRAREVTFSGEGRLVRCQLRDNANLTEEFRKEFHEFAFGGRLRFLLRTNDTTYFIPLLSKSAEKAVGGFRGQSILLQNVDIAFCRVFGVAGGTR